MSLLDRYVLRRFVSTYGLCLVGFLLLFLVVDFFSHLDDFLGSGRGLEEQGRTLWGTVGLYYATKLPEIVTQLGPYLTLFASIATLIGLARHNEIVPMLTAGRGIHRVLLPVYGFAAAVALALWAAEELVVPPSAREHAVVERAIKEEGEARVDDLPHLRDGRNVFSGQAWLPAEQTLLEVRSTRYVDPLGRWPAGSLAAERLAYRRHRDTGEVGWFPQGAVLRPADVDPRGRVYGPILLPPDRPLALELTPSEIDVLVAKGEPGLSRGEIERLIARYPERNSLRMELHSRRTRPASSLVLLLLGLPFVLRPGQRSVAAGLGVALGTCVVYFGAEFLFRELGQRGDVPPVFAAWSAPLLFVAVALARLDRIPT